MREHQNQITTHFNYWRKIEENNNFLLNIYWKILKISKTNFCLFYFLVCIGIILSILTIARLVKNSKSATFCRPLETMFVGWRWDYIIMLHNYLGTCCTTTRCITTRCTLTRCTTTRCITTCCTPTRCTTTCCIITACLRAVCRRHLGARDAWVRLHPRSELAPTQFVLPVLFELLQRTTGTGGSL